MTLVRFTQRWRVPHGSATVQEAKPGQVRDLPEAAARAAIAAGAAEAVAPEAPEPAAEEDGA